MKTRQLDINEVIPQQGKVGTWVGRCQVPERLAYKGVAGPHVVLVKNGAVYDLSEHFDTTSQLINTQDPVQVIKGLSDLPLLGTLSEILQNSVFSDLDQTIPYFLSPNDMQAIKACGVTFIQSLLERVIEEKAKGDLSKAMEIRKVVTDKIGTDLHSVEPGSAHAMKLKAELQEQGVWSQYLEVGIGKDAEIFTKGQPFSAVGFGAEIGVLEDSNWNNPEPEVVLAVSDRGQIVGATLGNDVNLRDYEGRSALLLGEAKDQNGSCAVGPLFRLFDETFNLDDVKNEVINLNIHGEDAFLLDASSRMDKISRAPESLVAQAIGPNHQYPDGLVLFCGTMFAPTKDRDNPGHGFTHKIGDQVAIYSTHLGKQVNWVNHCHKLPKWEFGIGAFVDFILERRMG
ncbi:fumarylacetoacetate hydrolase family protein [Fulvivirgaceae bacterium BMA12]|uniref:Fumarylacetoacetate hydrolase family protein n=1 Tax=Agaribacillus aureus TaxID=3051825 RepID=A0ABT8L5F3_9BACT|nr:fumarylacetoacetate hydrolase family protein [Fulvivirgaceae bacterium BMA12]